MTLAVSTWLSRTSPIKPYIRCFKRTYNLKTDKIRVQKNNLKNSIIQHLSKKHVISFKNIFIKL